MLRDQSAAGQADYRGKRRDKANRSLLCGVEGSRKKKKERKKEQRLQEQLLVLTSFHAYTTGTETLPLIKSMKNVPYLFLIPLCYLNWLG